MTDVIPDNHSLLGVFVILVGLFIVLRCVKGR